MKAIICTLSNGSGVLRPDERPVPTPGHGEVRVGVHVSGVNPIDWKSRARTDPMAYEYVPNHDGAGVVDAVGHGVDARRLGQRVWIWAAGWERAEGTAQEYVTLPEHLAVPLPDRASFDLGASLGIPALTAHRCLTVGEGGPDRLALGTLSGSTVLVAGGAGAVGNAAIQLARWAGAIVVATVSCPAKAALAKAAGAHHVLDYRVEDVAAAVLQAAPDGVDIIVEVAVAANAATDRAVLAPHGVVAFYAGADVDEVTLPVRELIVPPVRWKGVFLYTIPNQAKRNAVGAVSSAIADGALRVGQEAGLPLHRYPLARVGAAHDAVENNIIGKALVDVQL
jgi:NADPH2:quinone reductase